VLVDWRQTLVAHVHRFSGLASAVVVPSCVWLCIVSAFVHSLLFTLYAFHVMRLYVSLLGVAVVWGTVWLHMGLCQLDGWIIGLLIFMLVCTIFIVIFMLEQYPP